MNNKRGFTLIEVVLSTVLLASLVAVVLTANSTLFDSGADATTANIRDQRSQNIRNALLSMSNGVERDLYLAALNGVSDHVVVQYLVTPEFPWVSTALLPFPQTVDATNVTIDEAQAMNNYLLQTEMQHHSNTR